MVIHDVCPAKMRTEEQVPTAHKHDLGQQTRAEVMVGLGKRYTRSVQSQAPKTPEGGLPQGPLKLRRAR